MPNHKILSEASNMGTVYICEYFLWNKYLQENTPSMGYLYDIYIEFLTYKVLQIYIVV